MTPKEKIIKTIQTNLERERDKWVSGMKNDYLAWSGLEEELRTLQASSEVAKEIAKYQKFIKKMNLEREFKEFEENDNNNN